MRKTMSLLLVLMLVVTGCGMSDKAVKTDEKENEVETSAQDSTNTDKGAEDKVIEEETTHIKVMAPYGTPVLSMVKMFVEQPEIAENVEVEYEAVQATDVLSASLISHEADIAIVPTNLAATLHSKDVGYKIAGSSVWGVLYVVATDEEAITSIEDLKGKSLSLLGRNLTPDALLRYVLTENGINPEEDMTLEYFTGSSELATSIIAGETSIGMVPEPLLTNVLMKKEDVSVIIDLQEEWSKITGLDSFPQASIIVSKELIESKPEIVKAFLEEYEASVAWLNEHPAEAGTYYEGLDIGLNATMVEKAIPQCNLRYASAGDAKEALNAYLNVLYDFNPQVVGGQPVDEDMYFEE